MIRAALVGLGEIGQVHLPALRRLPQIELVGLCDLDRGLLAAGAEGERTYEDFEALLAEVEPDLVDVCLPHSLHEPYAVGALEAGAHVLLEKPMAVSLTECDRIIAAAEGSGRVVGVSHNQLFYGPHVEMRRMLEAGELGELRALRAKLAIGGKYGAWRADSAVAGGGLAIDAGAHRIYVIEALGGPARSVVANMDEPGEEDTYGILLELEGGAVGVIDACYRAPQGVFDDRVELVGTDGLAEATGIEAQFEGFANGPALRVWRDGRWESRDFEDDWTASVADSVAAFCTALDEGREPPVGPEAGRRLVAVIEAAYRSAREGRRVEL